MAERETVKAFELGDTTVREVMADTFSAEYRHGYYLREIIRSQSGGWLFIWARTTESYAKNFDWRTPVPEEQET